MSEQERPHLFVNFIIRALLGIGVIFFVNQYLASRGISVEVGLNGISFLTSGVFGIPGVGLLYAILFYKTL